MKDRSRAGEVWEIPRGPIWDDESAVTRLLSRIVDDARSSGVTAIFLSPTRPLPESELGMKNSDRRIHATATRIIDLTQTEESILAQMHQKGRYNIRVAEKAGVTVRQGSEADIDAFYELLKGTGGRDGFRIHQKAHYRRFLLSLPGSFFLIAEHEGRPIAGLLGVIWNRVGIYYYGASSYADRALMAPYLLQWEAMKLCKEAGCDTYDLLGIAASDSKKDPWFGISDFKRKFGGEVLTYPREQMIILRPIRKMLVDWKRRLFR